MDLPKVKGVYKEDSKLAHLTWFKVGGNADILFKPLDEEDLADFLKQIDKKTPVTIIGAGSNVIIRDKGIEGVVVKLANSFTEIETLPNGNLLAGAGCLNFNLAKYTQVNAIKGFEFLVGIPGTIGGGVAMNAGSYGSEFKDIVANVHSLDRNGNKMLFTGEDMGFGYRKNSLSEGYIFTKVEFLANHGDEGEIKQRMQEISAARSSTQPITEKTGGSTFANPSTCRAWELIDKAGLRGAKIGGAMMSEKHCNFMINTGNASASDLENLGELVINRVKEKTGIELKWEIKRIGRK